MVAVKTIISGPTDKRILDLLAIISVWLQLFYKLYHEVKAIYMCCC